MRDKIGTIDTPLPICRGSVFAKVQIILEIRKYLGLFYRALRSTRHQIGGLVWLQGCEVARFRGWCSMVYPPSDRWPGVAARLWG